VPPASVLALRFVAALAILAVGPYLLWDVGIRGGGPDAPFSLLEMSMLVSFVACAAVGAFACWQPVGCPFRPMHARRVLAVYLPAAFGWVLFLIAYLAVARSCEAPVPVQAGLQYLANGNPARLGFWFVVLTVGVGAPLAEEIVFRGYLQGALQQVMPAWPAIGIAAAAFGAVHGVPYALPIGLLGCLFGWLRARNGSLLPSMLAHAVHNSLIVLITRIWPGSIDLLYPQ